MNPALIRAREFDENSSDYCARYSERLTQFNCSFAASLHNATTPAQRQAAAQKLRRWELDLRAVAAAD